MSRRRVLAAAYLFDWAAGDPEWFPHPVRLIGKGIERGERILRSPGQTPAAELAAGGMLTFGIVVAAYLATAKTLALAHKRDRRLGFVVEMLLAWTCLASRSLHKEASAVVDAMEEGDNILARQRLARIVGRDTQALDQHEISRAVIETVAESSSDGVVAPLFYMAIGGVPLAMAYKAINTLDSMIGHADDRYFYFGKIAARLDDVANFLPSRLTALGIAAAAVIEDASPAAALETWWRDGMKHKSPNAGQPESAMAGALHVRLGGKNYYAGEPMAAFLLGADFPPPNALKARQAIRIVAVVSAVGAVVALLLRRGRR
ncbi:adenosylcobinamide-phosphate synthase CbiB [Tunturibacter empetritectus]|uniref:Cobalamin biosynthesis protein CobD n=1 Tax=Tunturiibacter empetritectus TaxID=3069691 RepID=A0A7W8IH50_9BACT|nr:adenosylcobinamide-phosphate synthase CbiB [Edaphobacter lichenicola]MBB5317102.1 adenosylcobinamide-phosphate synthase [Edaphobacter lichenicola]